MLPATQHEEYFCSLKKNSLEKLGIDVRKIQRNFLFMHNNSSAVALRWAWQAGIFDSACCAQSGKSLHYETNVKFTH